ncbi:transcription factor bHLH153-like isoform X3 [Primulina eburnea]|uniref:transcription factor bHLH153-like isoform X3 n=1 Tax=Primulina eburnea TaxID=1245227 RepID=UPI003C6C80A3
MLEELIEKKMIEDKRSLSSLDQSSFVNLIPKRLKTDVALSPKDKKEKVSERISALQQLVSPYGKTDTASVLFEAMEYLKFLHEQVLSAPYLYSTPTTQPLVLLMAHLQWLCSFTACNEFIFRCQLAIA